MQGWGRALPETVVDRAPEVVHAAPHPGLSFLPCCDGRPQELRPSERISHRPDEVTCNRLTAADELMLSGQPFVAENQNSEQLIFDMAVGLRTMAGPEVTLVQALQAVRAALAEVVPLRDRTEFWSAALMVEVTSRALQRLTD